MTSKSRKLLGFCLFLLVACGQNGSIVSRSFEASQDLPQVAEPVSPELRPTRGPQSTETDRAISKSQTVVVTETTQADVLIVIDNSASMRYEQANMAQRFGSLLDEMKPLDWRLAIITTDVSADAPRRDGRLLEFKGLPDTYYLSAQMPEDVVKTAFSETIQRPSREGHANEQGIKATYRSLEREQNWMRDEGSFNVVVVSDADESPPLGAEPDPRNSPSQLLSFIKTKFPGKPFYFHSIIVKEGDEECLKVDDPANDDNEGYGRTYAWLSEKTGGVIGSVCEADYSKQLKMIGQKVSQKVRSIELECRPLENSLTIRNDQDLPIPAFVVQDQTVQLAEPLPVGKNTVEYKCPESAGQ
ncbi:MAG: hypothetical protein ACK5Y2_00585 [Bdellovibrionales bacterium]